MAAAKTSAPEVPMDRGRNGREPGLSAFLLRPLLRLLRTYPRLANPQLSLWDALDDEARIPITRVQRFMNGAMAVTGDYALGLKAGRLVKDEEGGVLRYVVTSAATLADALQAASRYVRLASDGLELKLRINGSRAQLRLESCVQMTRAVAEYQAALFHSRIARVIPTAEFEWWFPFNRPANRADYEKAFSGASLRFSAPWLGCTFEAKHLDARLASADATLHGLLDRYANVLLARLPTTDYSLQTREWILVELAGKNATIRGVASRMRIGVRTLRRRLSAEGTTFTALLDDARFRLSLEYLETPGQGAVEVARLLHFTDVATFYRAFKRWTGTTPRRHQRMRDPQFEIGPVSTPDTTRMRASDSQCL